MELTLPAAKLLHTQYNDHVYEPSDDSFALVDAIRQDHEQWSRRAPKICIEVGCGSGYVICSAALMMQQLGIRCACYATDISEHALDATIATLRNHDIGSVDLVQGDLLAAFDTRLHHRVDLIFFNPPYVVTPDEELHKGGIARAWAGGKHGRVVIDRLLQVLHKFLSPHGRLYMVTVQENDPQGILGVMKTKYGFHGEIVLTKRADEELLHVITLYNSRSV